MAQKQRIRVQLAIAIDNIGNLRDSTHIRSRSHSREINYVMYTLLRMEQAINIRFTNAVVVFFVSTKKEKKKSND